MPLLLPQHAAFLGTLSERKQVYVLGTLLLYVFQGCKQLDVRNALVSHNIDFDFLGWRRHLRTNGLLLRDGKLYLYAKAGKKVLKPGTLDLDDIDKAVLDTAYRYRLLSSHLKLLLSNEDNKVMTAGQLDRFLSKVLSSDDLVTYTRKFINKKMNFIMKSYNMELEDLENTLKAYALYGLQRSYPRFEHVGHGIAIAKTVVKRSGINLIQELTTQKQNALLHDRATDSYSKTTVSLDGIADGTGQFLTADGTFVHRSLLVVGLGGANNDSLSWDTLHSLKQLCNNSRLKAKQRQFLNLMLGNYNEGFSTWLGQSNNELLEEVPYNSYMNKVCNFLLIPTDAACRFLSGLKPQLGGNADV